jgi:hypothetical protein
MVGVREKYDADALKPFIVHGAIECEQAQIN